jgi:hypothetical protein
VTPSRFQIDAAAVAFAAMEPPVAGRCDGSRKTSLVTCRNVSGCEQFTEKASRGFRCGVVKLQILPLTWARALPGVGLPTRALARSDDDGI